MSDTTSATPGAPLSGTSPIDVPGTETIAINAARFREGRGGSCRCCRSRTSACTSAA